MNERHIAQQMIALLDEGAQHVDSSIARRLQASRQKALSVQRVAEARFSLAGTAGMVWHEVSSFSRGWAMLIALVIIAAGAQHWGQVQRQAEIEEVDSALLADDLPIDAYLDHGFDAWLKDASRD